MTDGATAEPDPIALAEALERQQRIAVRLRNRLIDPVAELAPVPASSDVEIRPPDEVARRALALFVTAVRAESFAAGAPLDANAIGKRSPLAIQALSPWEQVFFAESQPPEPIVEMAGWRYESVFALQWALIMQMDLPWPDERCDLHSISRLMLGLPHEDIIGQARLRPVSELLDQLEFHYQLWHVIAESQQAGREIPAGLDPGVVSERMHALAWLLNQLPVGTTVQEGDVSDAWDETSQWIEDGMPIESSR